MEGGGKEVSGKGAFGCSPAHLTLVGGAGPILLSLSLVPVGAAGFSAGEVQGSKQTFDPGPPILLRPLSWLENF